MKTHKKKEAVDFIIMKLKNIIQEPKTSHLLTIQQNTN